MEALGRDRHARAMIPADRIITRVAARVGREPYELTGGRLDPASSLSALEALQTGYGIASRSAGGSRRTSWPA